MTFKKNISLIIYLALFLQTAKALTWKTVANGNWNAGGVWQGGVAPLSSTTSDTFLIRHDINITNSFTLAANALLQIDSTGGICGHYTVTVQSGAKIIKYGTLNIDVIDVPGGLVNCYNPGAVIITQYGVLSNGGQLNTFGCSFTVGPWFTCQFPNPEDNSIKAFEKTGFTLYPNPAQKNFTIKTNSTEKQLVEMFDANGQLVLLQTVAATTQIDVNNLNPGIYFVRIKTNTGVVAQKIMLQ